MLGVLLVISGLMKMVKKEVSICAIWDAEHMTTNSNEGLGTDYEIIIYQGRLYERGN